MRFRPYVLYVRPVYIITRFTKLRQLLIEFRCYCRRSPEKRRIAAIVARCFNKRRQNDGVLPSTQQKPKKCRSSSACFHPRASSAGSFRLYLQLVVSFVTVSGVSRPDLRGEGIVYTCIMNLTLKSSQPRV